MCTPACQKRAVAQQQNMNIQNRARGINQQLAAQAYNDRMNMVLQNRIHQQIAAPKKTYR